jgi:transposase
MLIFETYGGLIMPRRAQEVVCTEEELGQLQKLIKRQKTERRMHERAKIILECNKKKQNKDIAKELKIKASTVAKWRKRFIKEGVGGLTDEKRSGKPKKYGEEVRNNIFKVLEESPPKGQKSWDGETVAKRLGVSKDIVWKILKKEGIQLQRTRSWCVSTDKEFAAKSADIIGLYLNPPEKAIVLCVDEKPSIQALERKTGYVETSSGKIVRGLKSTYKRNGTLNLFAALNVATGAVKTEITKTKTRIDFQGFLDNILSTTAEEKEIHIILDNYCTHKRNDVWLKKYPNVYFHYTPTSASWLNQVEIWFGILTRKALRGGSFSSTQNLKKAIEEFVEVYHEKAKPFVWRKREVKGSQLKNTITNLRN